MLRAKENVGYKPTNIITVWLELIEDFVNVNRILQNQYLKKSVRKRGFTSKSFILSAEG